MTIRNCSRCGRMFQAEGATKLCSRCLDNDEEDFKVVREYVYDNPGANITEVSEETGVSEEKILKFLRQGKLMLKDEVSMVLDCERCGKPIKTGRFCDSCSHEMSQGLRTAANKAAESLQKNVAAQNRGMFTKQDIGKK